MSTTFLLKGGPRPARGKGTAHIARYNERGEIVGAWCWRTGFDVSSNVPWGNRQCKDCLRHYWAAEGT